MRKKRVAVCHAQVPFVQGGAELHVQQLIKELQKRNFESELIQLPYKWYPESSLYDSMFAWKMLDLSESNGEKIDLVIGTKFPSYGIEHENKVSWVIHQFRQAYDLFGTANGLTGPEGECIKNSVANYDKKSLSKSKKIYANSNNVRDRLLKYNEIQSETLYHPPSLYGRYQSGEYGEYILSAGRLDKLKRNDLLIEAVSKCPKSIRAKIAGKGPEMDYLKRLARKLKVEDRIDFLGYVPDSDLINLYANSFAVYFAPIDEDYGYITLEAFLSKKPVITCKDSGGPLEFVQHEESGFVNNPVAEEIAESIQKLYFEKNLAKEFGNSGYNAVEDISWDNVIEKLTCTL